MKSFCLKSLAIACALACGSAIAQNTPQTTMDKFNALQEMGIFTDTGDGGQAPDQEMDRSTAASVVTRLFNLDTSNPPESPSFIDVGSSRPWDGYVEAAVKAGIIIGQQTPIFSPWNELTYEDMTRILAKMLGEPNGTEASTVGGEEVSSLAQQYIQAAIAAGILDEHYGTSNAATRAGLIGTTSAPNPTAVSGGAGTAEGTEGGTPPEDPADIKSQFEQIMGMINDTSPPDPAGSPGPDTIGLIQTMTNEQVGLPDASGGNPDDPNNPDNQIVLATNNVGNEISLDDMMIEAVDNTIANSMTGTYTGDLMGAIGPTSVGGTISLEVGLTGADDFDGNVTFNSGASGTVKLYMVNAHDGTFISSGVISSSTIGISSSEYDVTDMTVEGSAIGANAKGSWAIQLENSIGSGDTTAGSGSFTATDK